jgi:hypothetical protein
MVVAIALVILVLLVNLSLGDRGVGEVSEFGALRQRLRVGGLA